MFKKLNKWPTFGKLYYGKEKIEETSNYQEALYLYANYLLAYGGNVRIREFKTKKEK